MQRTELFTVDLIYTSPHKDDGVQFFTEMLKNDKWFREHPITVAPCDSNGHYYVLDGRKRVRAAQLIGLRTVHCLIEDVIPSAKLNQHENLFSVKRHDITLAEQGRIICAVINEAGGKLNVTHVADALGVTIQWVLDRMRAWSGESKCERCGDVNCAGCWVDAAGWICVQELSLCPLCKRVVEGTAAWTITHQRACSFVPKVQCEQCKQWGSCTCRKCNCGFVDKLHTRKCPMFEGIIKCKTCDTLIDDHLSEHSGICLKCSRKQGSPAERGKVLCLEPKCKVWIKKPEPRGFNAFGQTFKPGIHFCKKHVKTTIDGYPLVDRDGDPIWISAGFVVSKVSQMSESHLTATLDYVRRSAETRAGLSSIAWEKLTNQRYPMLVAEAKRRDEKHKCGCDDGLKVTNSVESPTGTMVAFCTCNLGKMRKQAAEMADDFKKGAAEDGVTLEKRHVVTMVVAFIIGQVVTMPWITQDLVRYVLEALKLQ